MKLRGNTHLLVVRGGVHLLGASADPAAKKIAAMLDAPACKERWESGLWDGDDGALSETGGAHGTHFFNATGKDAWGKNTKTITYFMMGKEQLAKGTARDHSKKNHALAKALLADPECKTAAGKQAAWNLGLALHYVSDMTQPMHASGFSALTIPLTQHPIFEEYVPFVQARFPATGSWDGRCKGMDADQAFLEVAKRGNAHGPALMATLKYQGTICSITSSFGETYTGRCFIKEPEVDAQIGILLKDAYQSIAGWLYAALHA